MLGIIPRRRNDSELILRELALRMLESEAKHKQLTESLDRLTNLVETLTVHTAANQRRLEHLEGDLDTHVRSVPLHRPVAR